MIKEIKRDFFKDKHAIFVVTNNVKAAIILSMNNIMAAVKHHHDVILVVIDSASSEDIKEYLRTIQHERVIIEFLDENIGKALAVNGFIARHIDENNLPKTVWSIDPDILFDLTSFNYLLEAVQNIDNIGVLGMRYKDNLCNPENNLFLPPKNIKANNGKTYSVVFPVFCNVAGGIFAIKGEVLKNPLNFKLFPKKYKKVYGGDDASIHDELKKYRYKNGYLNGTLAAHLKSGELRAEEIRNFKE